MKFTQLYQHISYDLKAKLCYRYSTGLRSRDQLTNLASGTVVLAKQMHIGWKNHWAQIVFSFIFADLQSKSMIRAHQQHSQQHQEEEEERGKVRKPKRPRKGLQDTSLGAYLPVSWVPAKPFPSDAPSNPLSSRLHPCQVLHLKNFLF